MGQVERPSIRDMSDLAQRAEAGGTQDLVHLEIGEPDFDTPEHIVEAPCEAAESGGTNYASNAGLLDPRRAIAASIEAFHGVAVDHHEAVLVTGGPMEAVVLATFVVL